jgi:hypothetical protein
LFIDKRLSRGWSNQYCLATYMLQVCANSEGATLKLFVKDAGQLGSPKSP